jgi:hypothetical protein
MKQKDFLLIIISIFILTLLWVIFSIYHNYVTSTIKDPLTQQIISIEGKFNNTAINKIKERKKIDPFFETIYAPTPLPSLSPTPSIEIEPENVSTQSAINQANQTRTSTQSSALNP